MKAFLKKHRFWILPAISFITVSYTHLEYMLETEATMMTSRRSNRADVAEWRRRSSSEFISESFSIYVSVDGI